jgi:predicted transcriptional regulator
MSSAWMDLDMTLTLNLSPDLETLLMQRAERTGQELSSLAIALLSVGLSSEGDDFFDTVDGIQRGLDDFEQGQFSSLEDFVAEQNQKYGLTLEA